MVKPLVGLQRIRVKFWETRENITVSEIFQFLKTLYFRSQLKTQKQNMVFYYSLLSLSEKDNRIDTPDCFATMTDI